MNYHWLPSLSQKYETEFCGQRAIWISFLKDNQLEPQALLRDGVHLNKDGDSLMAEIVKAHLRYDPAVGPSPAEKWVTTHPIGPSLAWSGESLTLDFEGTGVVAMFDRETPQGAVRFTIDGRKPSDISELYAHGRSRAQPGGKWPPIAPIKAEKPLVLETWTLDATREEGEEERFRFRVTGSVTGPDGEGRSDQRFVSNSGRVVIDPEAWNVKFTMMLAQVQPPPNEFTVQWKVEPRFTDEWPPKAGPDPAREIWIANDLSPGKHRLVITGGPASGLTALETHAPPLASGQGERGRPPG
jgi:hypothetical protein